MEKKRILIVDDEREIIKILEMRLKVNGFEVKSADDGEAGLQAAKECKPDLIILDLMMPKLNGYEVCRMLKFDEQYKHIPIIILSALHEQKEREKAMDAGADSYFLKPYDAELLIFKIKSLTGLHQ